MTCNSLIDFSKYRFEKVSCHIKQVNSVKKK